MALATPTPGRPDDCVLATDDRRRTGSDGDGNSGYPAVRNVRAGDGVASAGLLLVIGQIPTSG